MTGSMPIYRMGALADLGMGLKGGGGGGGERLFGRAGV